MIDIGGGYWLSLSQIMLLEPYANIHVKDSINFIKHFQFISFNSVLYCYTSTLKTQGQVSPALVTTKNNIKYKDLYWEVINQY